MLDSHFEVRPLRIRANMKDDRFKNGGIPNNTAVKVEISEKDETGDTKANWIGLERSYGNGSVSNAGTTYCTGSGDYGPSSAGKRKYFTTDLTITTLAGANGQTVIVPVTETGECVWIYVDECDEEAEASTDLQAIRSAKITVTYGTLDDSNNFTADNSVQPVEYVINQHLLYKIQSDNDLDGNANTTDYYYIEHEEEYLYNFDAEDNYEKNQTQFEGMPWGLNGVQLSFDKKAFVLYGGWIKEITESVNKSITSIAPYYDFYLATDDVEIDEDGRKLAFGGYTFCEEIIADLNNSNKATNVTQKDKIGVLALNEQPSSAIEYCYNRNKRDENGNVVTMNWYMPAIDEIQEIVTKAYIQFDDFQNKFYWSCQPAYIQNFAHYKFWVVITTIQRRATYMIDNVNYARATRFNYTTGHYDESGVNGFKQVMTINGWDLTDIDYSDVPENGYVYNYEGSFTAYPMETETGYKHRTNEEDWCRVRAVRKMN